MTRANEIMQHFDRDAKITLDNLEKQIVATVNLAISKDAEEFGRAIQGVWNTICDLRTMIDKARYAIEKEK